MKSQPPKWPLPMPTSRITPTINLNQLPAEQKRQLWQRIKARRPELAELYQSEVCRKITELFDGEILMPMNEYQQLTEEQNNG